MIKFINTKQIFQQLEFIREIPVTLYSKQAKLKGFFSKYDYFLLCKDFFAGSKNIGS